MAKQEFKSLFSFRMLLNLVPDSVDKILWNLIGHELVTLDMPIPKLKEQNLYLWERLEELHEKMGKFY